MRLLVIVPAYSVDVIPGTTADITRITSTFSFITDVVYWNSATNLIEWLLAQLNGHGRFVIYYSGHGQPTGLQLTDSVTDITSYQRIAAVLSTLPSTVDVLTIFDCCYGGELKLKYNYHSGGDYHLTNISQYYRMAATIINLTGSTTSTVTHAWSSGSVFTTNLCKALSDKKLLFSELSSVVDNISINCSKQVTTLWRWVVNMPNYTVNNGVIVNKSEQVYFRSRTADTQRDDLTELITTVTPIDPLVGITSVVSFGEAATSEKLFEKPSETTPTTHHNYGRRKLTTTTITITTDDILI